MDQLQLLSMQLIGRTTLEVLSSFIVMGVLITSTMLFKLLVMTAVPQFLTILFETLGGWSLDIMDTCI